jgi:hypothetical protein
LSVALCGTLACGSSSDSADQDAGPVFVATTGAFASYHTWQSWSFTGQAITGSPHTSGPRTVYLNQAPPHGSTAFPVGTIIVKDLGPGPATADTTFAMVKRGGGFNEDGATNWEWFELQNNADGSVTILWRGAEPPAGQSYSGDPTACNTCHGTAKTDDFVQSPPLQLSNF